MIDQHITKIMCFRINKSKRVFAFCLYLFSFGIFYLLTFFKVKFFITLNCDECQVNDCEYFVVIDYFKKWNLCKVEKINYVKDLMEIELREIENSNYYCYENINLNVENLVFLFRNNTYMYNIKEDVISPIKFELSKYSHNDIHTIFGKGIHNKALFKYLQIKFGRNEIKLKNISIFHILLKQLRRPFFIYNLLSIVIYFLEKYFSLAFILLFLIIIILSIYCYDTNLTYKNMLNYSLSLKTNVIRLFVNFFLI